MFLQQVITHSYSDLFGACFCLFCQKGRPPLDCWVTVLIGFQCHLYLCKKKKQTLETILFMESNLSPVTSAEIIHAVLLVHICGQKKKKSLFLAESKFCIKCDMQVFLLSVAKWNEFWTCIQAGWQGGLSALFKVQGRQSPPQNEGNGRPCLPSPALQWSYCISPYT